MKFAAALVVLATLAILVIALPAIASSTNSLPLPVFVNSNSIPIACNQPMGSMPLQPGIYETHPYTCIVVVPEAQHDDCMVHGLAGTNSTMPISKPDLQFVPIPQKGK